MYGETLDFQCQQLATVTWKSLTEKNYCKNWFSMVQTDILCYHFWCWRWTNIRSLEFLHTLFDKYLDHMLVNLEQDRFYELLKILSFLTKKVNDFW